jgi:hypothetical protein
MNVRAVQAMLVAPFVLSFAPRDSRSINGFGVIARRQQGRRGNPVAHDNCFTPSESPHPACGASSKNSYPGIC